MPVKQFKGFLRRKSAGNALETYESQSPTGSPSSFRVLSRAEVTETPTGFIRVRQQPRTTLPRPNSSPGLAWGNGPYNEEQILSNRTNNSSSTGNVSQSDRNSYASTKPSSLDSKYEEDVVYGRKPVRSPEDVSERAGERELRQRDQASVSPYAGGRPFSISLPRLGRSNKSPQRRADESGRDRSMTGSSIASSASTAMPLKLDLAFGVASGSPTSHQSWFDNTPGGRRSVMEEPGSIERGSTSPLPPQPAARSESDSMLATKKQFSWEDGLDYRPAPLSSRLDQSPAPDLSARRRSWESDESEKDFLSRGSYQNTPDRENNPAHPSHIVLTQRPTKTPDLQKRVSHDSYVSQDSPFLSATDDQGLLDVAWASQALDARYGQKLPKSRSPDRSLLASDGYRKQTPTNQTTPFNRPGASMQSSSKTTPRAAQDYDEQAPLFGNRPKPSAGVDASRERASTMIKTNKIMTPAEFENYKRTATDRSDEDGESQHSDDSDAYEDEDEVERQKQITRQRRKQEAHLAVYRQQMMKVTGEQPADLPSTVGRPEFTAGARSLSRMSGMPTLDPKVTSLNTSDDDEDDEIPLGVLQAHGFPSRLKPPTSNSSGMGIPSRPGSQLSAYPAPLNATRNEPTSGGGGDTNLPPFARSLPQDPYVGASLVNQANRESLQQNGHRSTGLPPGGLVGVIAGEERARAMRRGSPNVNGTYTSMSQQQSMPLLPSAQIPHHGMPPMGMGMPFTPMQQQSMINGEQPPADMNNMMQMMQVQMQWMQQMMGLPPQMQMMPGSMMPQGALSEAGTHNPSNFLSPLPFQSPTHRDSAYSTLDPYNQRNVSGSRAPSAMGSWQQHSGPAANYASSIAPSERSNVGQPSRYRPVNPANVVSNSRTNTLSSTNQLNNPRSRSRSPHKLDLPANASQGLGAVNNSTLTIRAVNKPKKGTGATSDDEEDDAGWAEMKKRRDDRKSRWNARKQAQGGEMGPSSEAGGLEGLYYDG